MFIGQHPFGAVTKPVKIDFRLVPQGTPPPTNLYEY
jgi:hypothetical protein